MEVPQHFGRERGGIVVPITLSRFERVVTQQEFVKLKRLMAFARTQNMTAMYFCQDCKQPIKLTQYDRLIELQNETKRTQAKGGRFTLDCGCTRWTVR